MAENIRVQIEGSSRDLQVAVAEAVASLKVLEREVRSANRSGGLRQIGDDTGAADVQITGLAAGIRNFRTVGLTSLVALTPAAAAGVSSLGAAGGEALAGLAPLVGLLATLPAGAALATGALGTLAIGMHGVTDAIKGNQRAYDKLSPAAKQFVVDLHGFLPELKQIQATAQRKMFPGFLEALHELTPLLGPANRIVGEFAGTLGHLAKQGAGFLVDPRRLRELEALFHQGDVLLGRGFRGGENVFDAVLQSAIAARPLTDAISKDVLGLTRDFDHLIAEARSSGDLQSFFRATLDVTETLVTTLGNLGGAFINVGKIAFPFGDRMLHGLEDITGQFQEWTRSAEGKNGIGAFFQDAQPPLHELSLLVVALGRSLGQLVQEGLVPLADLAHVARVDLLPLIDQLGVLLGEILPPLISTLDHVLRLGNDVAPALQLLVGPLKGLLTVINGLADALDGLAKISPLLGAAGTGAAIVGGIAAVGKLKDAWVAVRTAAIGAAAAETAAGTAGTVAAGGAVAGAAGGAAGRTAAGRRAATGIGRDIQVLGGGEALAGAGVGAGFLTKIKGLGPRLRVLGKAGLWTSIALGVLDGIGQKGGLSDKIDQAVHSWTLGLLPGAGDRNSPDLIKRLNALKDQQGPIRNLGNVAKSLNPFGSTFGDPAQEQNRARKLLDILKQIPAADQAHLRGLQAQAAELSKQLGLTDREKGKIAGLAAEQQRVLDKVRGQGVAFNIGKALAADGRVTRAELQKMKRDLATLPPAAAKTARDTIAEMTRRLVNEGQLPVSAFRRVMRSLKQEADHGGVQLNTSLASSFSSLLSIVSASSAGLFPPLNAALKALGVKPIKVTAKSFATTALGLGAGVVGALTKERGGFLPGTPDLKDHTIVAAAKDEAFLTRHQQRPIQAALARDKARGEGSYGSLQEVFGSVTTKHYMASGGYVQITPSLSKPLEFARGGAAPADTSTTSRDQHTTVRTDRTDRTDERVQRRSAAERRHDKTTDTRKVARTTDRREKRTERDEHAIVRMTGGVVGDIKRFAQGGFAGPFGSGEGFVPVTNLAREKFSLRPTSGRTNHSPLTATGRPSDHATGDAVDYSNGVLTSQEDAFAGFWKSQLSQVVKQLIWRDRIQSGSGIGGVVPDHQDHVHLALQHRFAFDAKTMGKLIQGAVKGNLGNLGDLLGGLGGDAAAQIKKVSAQGPAGGLRDLAQGSLDKLVEGANTLLASKAGAAGASPGESFAGFKGPWVDVEHQIAKAKKWSVADWDWVLGHESGGRPNAKNPTSTAFGLGQLLDSTYATYGGGPGSSAVEQIKAMARYIAARYGNTSKAKAFWQAHGYYERGGFVGGVQDSIDAIEQSFDAGGTVTAAEKPPAKNPYAPPDKPQTPKQQAADKQAADNKRKAAEEKRSGARKRQHEHDLKGKRRTSRQRVASVIERLRSVHFRSGLPYLGQIEHLTNDILPPLKQQFELLDSARGRHPVDDALVGREAVDSPDTVALNRRGHRYLDIGVEQVADLNLAGQGITQLDPIIAIETRIKQVMQSIALQVKDAIRKATKTLDERKAHLRHLTRMVDTTGDILSENRKKKPDHRRLGRLQSELEHEGHTIGLRADSLRGDQGFMKRLHKRLTHERDDEKQKIPKIEVDLGNDSKSGLKEMLVSLTGVGGGGQFGLGQGGDLQPKAEALQDDLDTRAGLTPSGLRERLQGFSPKGASTSASDSGLADLIRQHNTLLEQTKQLGRLNAPVIPGLLRELPFLGGFARGIDRVPYNSIAVLHRDERVVPDPQGPGGSQLQPNPAAGPVTIENTFVFRDRAGSLVELVDSRVRANTPGIIRKADRVIGARGRQLAHAPGSVG